MINFMEDKRFDKIIENMIDEYQLKYSHDSWRRLEHKLNYEEKEDALFDRVIASKLNNFRIPMSASSFARFEKKANHNSYRSYRKHIYIIGIAASFLLMIFTIGYDAIFEKNSSNKVELAENDITRDITKKNSGDHGPVLKTSDESEMISLNINNTIVKNDIRKISQYNLNSIKINTPSSDFGIRYSFRNQNPFLLLSSVYLSNDTNLAKYDFNNVYGKIINFDVTGLFLLNELKPEFGQGNFFIDSKDEAIRVDAFQRSKSDGFINVTEYALSDNAERDKSKEVITESKGRGNLNIQVYGSPVVNLIKTPNDITLKVPGYGHSSLGYNAGVGISKYSGKHEFGIGFEYQGLIYSPKKVVVAQGNKAYWLDKIGINKIGIPFFYKYHFKTGKKINLYASASINPLLLTKSSYEFIENESGTGNLIKLASELLENNDFKQTVYASKDYSKGILDGGNTSGNTSLAMNFGLGFKAQLSHGIALYFEPEISTALLNSDVGPNNDRITSINFKIGINKSFNL
jgi:hypothetical protein